MARCPDCGHEEEYNSETCANCQYTFRYDDRADYGADDVAFTVTFRCLNCNGTFEHGFGEGDEVRPKNVGNPGFSIDEVTGNPHLAIVDGQRCRPRCPTCGKDTSLYVSERTPA